MKKTFTKSIQWLLSTLLIGLGFSACDKWGEDPACEYGVPHANYKILTKVVNKAQQPIPEIQVKVYNKVLNNPSQPISELKTNENGSILFDIETFPTDNISLECIDIDGATNGKFKNKTASLTFISSDYIGGSGWNKGSVQKEITITLDEDTEE